jgi:hypothetical protein
MKKWQKRVSDEQCELIESLLPEPGAGTTGAALGIELILF